MSLLPEMESKGAMELIRPERLLCRTDCLQSQSAR